MNIYEEALTTEVGSYGRELKKIVKLSAEQAAPADYVIPYWTRDYVPSDALICTNEELQAMGCQERAEAVAVAIAQVERLERLPFQR